MLGMKHVRLPNRSSRSLSNWEIRHPLGRLLRILTQSRLPNEKRSPLAFHHVRTGNLVACISCCQVRVDRRAHALHGGLIRRFSPVSRGVQKTGSQFRHFGPQSGTPQKTAQSTDGDLVSDFLLCFAIAHRVHDGHF